MAFEALVPLAGSEKAAPAGATLSGSLHDHELVTATVILRRKADAVLTEAHFSAPHNRAEFEEAFGADPGELAMVEHFAHSRGLTIVDRSISKRRIIVSGRLNHISHAFGTRLHAYQSNETGQTFRGRSGSLSIPQELQHCVVAVLGLDNRPIARAHFRMNRRKHPAAASTTFTPLQVAALYGFPATATGAGQTIGIIELGGGYLPTDLATYFKSLNVKAPSVTAISVDGGANTPGGSADGEVMLDIEVAGSIAPGANIAVYFAPNTDQGFIDAISDAVHDSARTPSVISISWGGPEDSWTSQSRTALNAALQDAAALGVTVTAASGDNGSTDGEAGGLHVDFPASSPFALACGGTKLAGSGSNISSEVVWNETANKEGATGGGVSAAFALPAYQQSAGVPAVPSSKFVGRGVPDVAGNADPVTGYKVLVDGRNEVVGGTSAVAPLWAALVALLNQQLGKKLGFLNPTLYGLGEKVFHDITSGNNDDGNLGFYSAKKGWDPCTGLGSPNAAALLSALSSSSSATAKSGQ